MKDETQWHQAVLADDLITVRKFLGNEEWHKEPNYLGYTPLELAHYLGKEAMILLLEPESKKHRIKVDGREFSQQTFYNFFKVKYRSYLHFVSYEQFKRVIANCPWILKSSPIGKENRELGKKYKKELRRGVIEELEIKWIDEKIGYGLFAGKELPQESYLGSYTGLLRDLKRLRPNYNSYCFHYPTRFWSWNYMMVDALKEGNEMRFINHSQEPNLEPRCLVDRGLLHLAFFSSRKIEKGEELTFDYGWKLAPSK